ncbi:tRNA threonylcarbamoyladenosine dehydratase [Smittium mucronatum]|uniref:tRNA threonylcarbamoyladenosine dehydratase n=1 Tax=Smittium mucronatum TaxID=133383 RepID=A0A1R0H8F5_9FUNG|nr:tRNA threonylcarbamoyladenosine dehydratase [Smittium mucronatum]
MEATIEKVSEYFSNNRNAQFALVAATASALTLSTVFTIQKIRRNERVKEIKKTVSPPEFDIKDFKQFGKKTSTKESIVVNKETRISLSPSENALFAEQLSRNSSFFGQENLEKIKSSFVIVVGAGGVGSWAALMLIRSGVQRIRLVDFDQVTLSSLNRHAVALRSDVGLSKVETMKNRFLDIVPHLKVDARVELISKDNQKELLSGNPDYVLDCIDNIDTKLDLLKYCYDNKIKVISAMGAGMKSDPSRVQISDIGNTFEDPLSRAVRRKMKKMGIENGIEVVYSTEKPGKVQLLSLSESQEEKADEFSVLPDFRVRIVPVLGTMPAIFGMVMATRVLTELGDFPTEPLAIKGRNALYVRLHRDLMHREGTKDKIQAINLTTEEIGYIFEEMWMGKSAISGSVDKLCMVRYYCDKPLGNLNCVCMTKKEAEVHCNLKVNPDTYYDPKIVSFIKSRIEIERLYSSQPDRFP